jgi:hypothetical protein
MSLTTYLPTYYVHRLEMASMIYCPDLNACGLQGTKINHIQNKAHQNYDASINSSKQVFTEMNKLYEQTNALKAISYNHSFCSLAVLDKLASQ